MKNSASGTRVALAAAVVAVMAMSAMSAEAAARRNTMDGGRKVQVGAQKRAAASGARAPLFKMPSASWMIERWLSFDGDGILVSPLVDRGRGELLK